MKPVYIFIIVGVVAAGLLWWFLGGGERSTDEPAGAVGVEGTPRDVVADFYLEWLQAVQSTSTDPFTAGLAGAEFLAPALRNELAAAGVVAAIDPVLCQDTPPEQVAIREIYSTDTEAKLLVLGRGPERAKMPGQATVTLAGNDGLWTIEAIECGAGETAPEREFSFEQEGFLLKDSLPESFNTSYWHLVYEQNDQTGYTVPLFFSEASNCGTEVEPVTCDEAQFTEAMKVLVKGEMTEAGLNVLWFETVVD